MLLFIVYVVLSTTGLILFKLGSENISLQVTKSFFSIQLPFLSILGLICYLISFLLWMYIISKSDISYIVPLGVALTNLAIITASYFVFNETISVMTIVGAALIIIGAIILNIK